MKPGKEMNRLMINIICCQPLAFGRTAKSEGTYDFETGC
jgi:hypothetical protein